MKGLVGIIPAAGNGTRLGEPSKPLTDLGSALLIEFPMLNMIDFGVDKTVIIQRGTEISDRFGNNYRGMDLEYVTQNYASGLSDAILLARHNTEGSDLAIVLGDIVYRGVDLPSMKQAFHNRQAKMMVGVRRERDHIQIAQSYGIRSKPPILFVEKPGQDVPLQDILGLGIYLASNELFELIEQTPHVEDKVDFTGVLNTARADYHFLTGQYINTNTPKDLAKAKILAC